MTVPSPVRAAGLWRLKKTPENLTRFSAAGPNALRVYVIYAAACMGSQ
ncbi:MAG: hypothetical protein J7J20_03960 [Desulfurococcales archaeon]|nr:hypothetical protein [Desulfurococcales archaeon]